MKRILCQALIVLLLAPASWQFAKSNRAPAAGTVQLESSDGPGSVETVSEKPAKKKGKATLLIIAAAVVGAAAYFLLVNTPKGKIDVQSTPSGATIWLDGQETGKSTPALLERVKPGDRVLTLKKEGFQDSTLTVTVEKNQTASASVELLAAAMTENFDDGNADNWANNGQGTWQVVGGVYCFSGTGSGGEAAYSWYDLGSYADFTCQAKIRNGGDQGLAFRGNPASGEWYVFYAWGTNWAVFHLTPSDFRYVLPRSPSMALKYYPEWNIFKVVAKGSNFGFYINGMLVGSAYDSSLAKGRIGLYVRNYSLVKMEADDVSVSLSTTLSPPALLRKR